MDYSVTRLVDRIDEHPYRWEVITLESVLSLPTLMMRGAAKCVYFFFYPIGGPPHDQKIGVPYYSIYGTTDSPPQVSYEPIARNVFEPLPTNDTLGLVSLGSYSRSEYDAQVEKLYQLTDKLLLTYWQPETREEADAELIRSYRSLFNEIVFKPLLPAYRLLNPSFMSWVEQSS